VVIPLYNKRNHIVNTVESVLAQQHPVEEIIVVDDGSTDGGVELLDAMKLSQVRVIKQENAGVSRARNVGIKQATCDFVALLDADDSWSPQFLKEIAASIKQIPNAGIYATAYQLKDGDELYHDAKIRGLPACGGPRLLDNYFSVASSGDLPFITSSVCLNKKVLQGRFAFPESEPMGEDQDVWSRVALFSAIVYSPRILVLYNRGADNRACVNNIPVRECPFSRRLTDFSEHHVPGGNLRSDILKYSAAHLLSIAKLNIRAGNYRQAERLLRDPRCWRKPVHKLWCETMRWIYQLRSC